ncbi:MAG: hypothetical protein ABSG22_10725 [Sedimentisphaerales bacterium]
MKKDIIKFAGTCLYVAMLIAGGWFFGRGYESAYRNSGQRTELNAERQTLIAERIPTIEEIQQLIGCEKIDGKIGPETIAKWNRMVCDQYAQPYFKKQTINSKNKE